MRTGLWVVLAVVVGTGLPTLWHLAFVGWSPHQVAMSFFFWLNAIIALWEICLFLHIDRIEEQHAQWAPEYAGRELDRVIELFTSPMSAAEVLSTRRWSEIWSSYSLFDKSYADRTSFGFFVDIGNGFSTLIPSVILAFTVTMQLLPARAFGLLCVVASWQMFYGTVVYFTSYVMNRRYVGHSAGNIALFVGLSNGIWLFFPLWTMWVGVQMVYAGSYAVFGG